MGGDPRRGGQDEKSSSPRWLAGGLEVVVELAAAEDRQSPDGERHAVLASCEEIGGLSGGAAVGLANPSAKPRPGR